ncbi:hypothetical protein BDU57DRAFT_488858 [Ampelomyces quisqualis]|uniref:Fungal-specific transcription factor domain-containing protein n=1 Tax=Ampelomyces quisqualis TaxID=50730 RepID=A0A6A5QZP6_AMPQU|nr:hypothetical protein BDU57DRAFT_488858 [Ampelomyces quisqualis]
MTFVDATIVASRRKIDRPHGALSTSSSTLSMVSSPGTMILPPSVPIPPNPQEIYIMFARSHLAKDGPDDLSLRALQSMDIARLGANSMSECQTAHLRAVLSFATIFFGTKHRQTEITRQGFLSHGVTLQQLNRALLDPKCHEFDEVIVSVITLAIQETLVSSGPDHFLNHMSGLEKLIALRDPRLHCSPNTISLYRCLRHMLLFAALGTGRSTILAKPEWKTMLRQHCENEEQLQEQLLYDILADCSVLASERDKLFTRRTARRENASDEIQIIRTNTEHLCEQLWDWKINWGANPANAYMEIPTVSNTHIESTGIDAPSIAPTALVFANITSALTLMLYNIALMHLLQILVSIHSSLPQTTPRDHLVAAAHSAVLDICRCMPNATNENFRRELHASPVAHCALQTARTMLQGDDSVNAKWLMSMLDRKSATSMTGRIDFT